MNPSTMIRLVTAVILISVLFTVVSAVQEIAATPSYRQYDPALIDEMYQKGLISNISPEDYERELALLNESTNQTLGCDDYPRCNIPGAPLSPVIPVLSLALIALVMKGAPGWNTPKEPLQNHPEQYNSENNEPR